MISDKRAEISDICRLKLDVKPIIKFNTDLIRSKFEKIEVENVNSKNIEYINIDSFINQNSIINGRNS